MLPQLQSRIPGKEYKPTYLPLWRSLGGEAITLSGASVQATIPVNASIVLIKAEDEDVYYEFNVAAAHAGSPGYIPQNGGEIVGPLSNLYSLHVYGAATAIAHIQYFRETES